jgi:hypothetical protein
VRESQYSVLVRGRGEGLLGEGEMAAHRRDDAGEPVGFVPPVAGVVGEATEAEMAAFWGPNWKAELEAALASSWSRPLRHLSGDELLAFLDARMRADADV